MRLFRTAAAVGLAKKGFHVLRKPENQARIKSGISALRSKAASRGRKGAGSACAVPGRPPAARAVTGR